MVIHFYKDLNKIHMCYSKNEYNNITEEDQLKLLTCDTIIFEGFFNRPLNEINIPKNIKKIKFVSNFTSSLNGLHDDIEQLDFNDNFNNSVDCLPKNLKILKLGYYFNQPLDNLPCNLEELYLPPLYNLPINFLPSGLKKLDFANGSRFSQSLDYLPNGLKELNIPKYYQNEINYLPDSIEDLKIGIVKKLELNEKNSYFECERVTYSDYGPFFKNILNLPANLKVLRIFWDYFYLNELKKKFGEDKIIVYKN